MQWQCGAVLKRLSGVRNDAFLLTPHHKLKPSSALLPLLLVKSELAPVPLLLDVMAFEII